MNNGFHGFPSDGSGLLQKIGEIVLTGTQAEINIEYEFSSYQTIRLIGAARTTNAGTATTIMRMRFNKDAGASSYAFSRWNRFGSSNIAPGSYLEMGDIANASNLSHIVFDCTIFDPGSIIWRKTFWSIITTNNAPQISTGEWLASFTYPITSIQLFPTTGSLVKDSYVHVYGIRK